jgi:hypothetical protein
VYFVQRFLNFGISGLPPFFSHARGSPVVWASENLRINIADVAYSVALKARAAQFAVGGTLNYGEGIARNGSPYEAWYQNGANNWRTVDPSFFFAGFDSRVAFRTGADYSRAATVDGNTVVSGGTFSSPPTPAYLEIGKGNSAFFGRFDRFALWRRALNDAELLKAWSLLGERLP